MNNKTDIEEDIKILYEITKGDEDCLRIDLANNNTEDIEHWKREIEAIKKVVNTYYKEKARANKLEKEYSKMLTKIDEYEADDRANKYDSLVENIKELRKNLNKDGFVGYADEITDILEEVEEE